MWKVIIFIVSLVILALSFGIRLLLWDDAAQDEIFLEIAKTVDNQITTSEFSKLLLQLDSICLVIGLVSIVIAGITGYLYFCIG